MHNVSAYNACEKQFWGGFWLGGEWGLPSAQSDRKIRSTYHNTKLYAKLSLHNLF